MRCLFLIFMIVFTTKVTFSQENKQDKEKGYIDLSVDGVNVNKNNLNLHKKVNEKYHKKANDKKNETIKKDNHNTKSKVTIGKLNSPSIGSLGIETKLNEKYGLNLWNKFTAREAIIYLNYIPNVVSSNVLQNHLVDLYASVSLPPQGDTKDVIKFLETKLLKLSSSGYANSLNDIVRQPQFLKIIEFITKLTIF